MQTDPIGYGDGMNWYAYVGGDPINMVDPYGLEDCPPNDPHCVVVTGPRRSCTAICLENLPAINITDASWLNDILDVGKVVVVWGKRKSKLCKKSTVMGMYNARHNTAIGLWWAGVSYVGGKLLGTNPKFVPGKHGIRLVNAPFQASGRAVSLGNVQIYGTNNGPDGSVFSYSKIWIANGPHEDGHTMDAEKFGDAYLPMVAIGAIFQGDKSFMEGRADAYAKSCQ